MKKIYLLYIILLSHCLLGCKEQNKGVEEMALLGYNPTELNSAPYTRLPHRVEIQNDILVLLDLASDSMFYHFFDFCITNNCNIWISSNNFFNRS